MIVTKTLQDCDCNLDGSTGGSCDEIGQCYCKNDTITGMKPSFLHFFLRIMFSVVLAVSTP